MKQAIPKQSQLGNNQNLPSRIVSVGYLVVLAEVLLWAFS